jgi:putative membrane protein
MVASSVNYQLAVVAATMLLFAASLWRPIYPDQQWLQHIPTVLALPALLWGARRRWLSNASFTCLAMMLALHIVGARWIYSNVPYDEWFRAALGGWTREWLGWTRNHYDRLVHFAFGLLMTLPVAEATVRYGGLSMTWGLAWAWMTVAGVSALYEVFEWAIAIIAAPDYAEQYNGQQGDWWDAQKDMALALLGSTLATLVLGAGLQRQRRRTSK